MNNSVPSIVLALAISVLVISTILMNNNMLAAKTPTSNAKELLQSLLHSNQGADTGIGSSCVCVSSNGAGSTESHVSSNGAGSTESHVRSNGAGSTESHV